MAAKKQTNKRCPGHKTGAPGVCNSCPRGDSGPREPGLGARVDGATGKEGRQKARHGESTDMVLTSVLLERTCEASGCDSDRKPAPGGSWGVLRGPEGT